MAFSLLLDWPYTGAVASMRCSHSHRRIRLNCFLVFVLDLSPWVYTTRTAQDCVLAVAMVSSVIRTSESALSLKNHKHHWRIARAGLPCRIAIWNIYMINIHLGSYSGGVVRPLLNPISPRAGCIKRGWGVDLVIGADCLYLQDSAWLRGSPHTHTPCPLPSGGCRKRQNVALHRPEWSMHVFGEAADCEPFPSPQSFSPLGRGTFATFSSG